MILITFSVASVVDNDYKELEIIYIILFLKTKIKNWFLYEGLEKGDGGGGEE